MSSILHFDHRCPHCKKRCNTSQGLLQHIKGVPACASAFDKLLAKHRRQARRYDPHDPESHPRDDEPPVGWEDESLDITFDDIPDQDIIMNQSHPFNPISSNPSDIPLESVNQRKPEPATSLFTIPFPNPAGTILHYAPPSFEVICQTRAAQGHGFFHPFVDQEEWELAQTLMTSGMSMNAVDKILRLPIMRDRCQTSYKNKDTLLKKIDALPIPGTPFMHTTVKVTGDQVDGKGDVITEELDLFYRDPVECVQELISNPAFRESLHYAPEQIFENETCEMRIYNEMHTADWWWETQEKLPPGATIAPVLLASDKTKLSYFSGDKAAWPVYLSIANILKAQRRQPNSHAMILLGYIPVSKLKCFSKSRQSLEGHRLFHYCMSLILSTMRTAGIEGVEMICADNGVRRVYPLLAAYIADFPEQCLVTCVQENFCPKCPCLPEDRGNPLHANLRQARSQESHLKSAYYKQVHENSQESWPNDGVRLIIHPFWEHLPHCNIFECMTPDVLHQLHKGVFKDHLTTWCTSLIGKTEMDARFMAMSPHPSIRHFKNGISSVAQWTGTEYKNMEKVFLGVIHEAKGLPPDALSTARAILDFIYLAQFQSHSTATLGCLAEALQRFHKYKNVFIMHGCRLNFQIPKFHSMEHYVDAIKTRGTTDGYNTELPERLHIDFAKIPYRGSNKRQYIDQMIKWVTRQEKIRNFDTYLRWQQPMLRNLEEGVGEEDGMEHSVNGNYSIAADGDPNDEEERVNEENGRTYQLAKRPAFPNMPIQDILTRFHTPELIPLLTNFLKKLYPSQLFHINEAVHLDLYKKVSFKLHSIQQLDGQILTDVIRAIPSTPSTGRCKAIPGQFDTVLVHYSHLAQETGALGYRVARIRAIFRLPPYFGYPHPLAYIEWYSDLPNSPITRIEMYRVSRSVPGVKAAVIPLDSVRRSCHLIPRMGATVNRAWRTDDVLELAPQFLINDYLDMYTYQFFNDY